jgi:soluble lytic murein transglycosylase-like protein
MISRLCVCACFVLGSGLSTSGWADIYSYTGDDGTVSLSNVPADSRYTVLIAAPREPAVDLPVTEMNSESQGPDRNARYDELVEKVSNAYGIEGALIHAVISVESGYDAKAVSRKGAVGLMQLMPKTAKYYGVANTMDPAQNLDGGARYLRDLLNRFDHNVGLALAAYNAGENAVIRYSNRIPPFRETLSYVPKVLEFYRRYQQGL